MNSKTMLALSLCLLPTISFSAKRESFKGRAHPALKPTTIKEPNKFLTPSLGFLSGLCFGYGAAKGSRYCIIGTAVAEVPATIIWLDKDTNSLIRKQAHQIGIAIGCGFMTGLALTTAFQYYPATPNEPK